MSVELDVKNFIKYSLDHNTDLLNAKQNTWDVKKHEANQKQHCKQEGAIKNFDIS